MRLDGHIVICISAGATLRPAAGEDLISKWRKKRFKAFSSTSTPATKFRLTSRPLTDRHIKTVISLAD